MIEFDQGHFNLDHPSPSEGPHPSSRYLLNGWVVGKTGQHFSDVRVHYDGQIWPAVFGVLRPDLVEYFQTEQSALPAQFDILITLYPGIAELNFEVLDAHGNWLPIPTVRLNISAPSAPRHSPDPTARINAAEMTRILWQILRAHASEPSTSLEALIRRVVSSLAYPRYLRHPAPPLYAFFHEPAMLTRSGFGRVLVDGYLFHAQQRVRRVLATFDLITWQPLSYHASAQNAAKSYPQFPNATHSQATGYIDLPAQLPQPAALRIYAELEDGSLHLCSTQLTSTFSEEDEKRPLPPASPLLLWRTASILRRQLQSRGAELESGPSWRRELWMMWKKFARFAPKHTRPQSHPSPSPSVKASSNLGKILLITHNLNYEGAPLFLCEYARYLIGSGGAQVTVITAEDGPLHAEFIAMGASIQMVDTLPLLQAKTKRQRRKAMDELRDSIHFSDVRLLVANTLPAFWAIHLAHESECPSLFYIHESTTPSSFYLGQDTEKLLPYVERSFELATRVSFLTAATSRYYKSLSRRPNYFINPGWIDLGAISDFNQTHSREFCRERLGLKPDQKLVVNIGSVCERKGQHIFARAVELFCRSHSNTANQCEFWMIGGRDTPFDTAMNELLVELNRSNLRVIPATPHVYEYYRAADLFVCSSYEESFPRVILEAMAFGIPILSTNVHGVPEMVRTEQEALLVPPGDTAALAGGIADLLMVPEKGKNFATQALKRVRDCYGTDTLLPRHLAFAHETIMAAAKES